MAKLYLTEDKRLAISIRDLLAIDINCGLLNMSYHLPTINFEEENAVALIQKYCKKNISELLKKCDFYATLTKTEESEESEAHKDSIILKSTIGNCCVLIKEAEMVLVELQRLDKCQMIQKALQEAIKTGRHLLIMI